MIVWLSGVTGMARPVQWAFLLANLVVALSIGYFNGRSTLRRQDEAIRLALRRVEARRSRQAIDPRRFRTEMLPAVARSRWLYAFTESLNFASVGVVVGVITLLFLSRATAAMNDPTDDHDSQYVRGACARYPGDLFVETCDGRLACFKLWISCEDVWQYPISRRGGDAPAAE